jgi:hypothetical protein
MKCDACERGDHDQCNMATWCDCDCEGYEDGSIPAGHYFQDDLDGGRLVAKSDSPPRCVCGHTADQHANIGGCGACRVHPCPCERWHDRPMPDQCECEVCWRESNMPPRCYGPPDVL